MPTIINIESAINGCSVALSVDSVLEFSVEEKEPMQQSVKLAPFVASAMEEITRKGLKLDVVAVSAGPGSYTGLRIGMSLAKGLAFSQDVPVIGVDTLQILAVKAMFRNMDWQGDEILVPMIDARRMEVYMAAYDFRLDAMMKPQALVITPDSLDQLPEDRQIYLMGDGCEKTKGILKRPGLHWIDGLNPTAKDMIALSEKAFREGDIMDIAYGTPHYIKDYNAVIGENPLAQLLK